MAGNIKIIAFFSLLLLPVLKTYAQPLWLTGTPAVISTGALTITINYGIDRLGTVYIIVYNFDNSNHLTSSNVRNLALAGPNGSIVATSILAIKRADIKKTLQVVINVTNPNQIHTIFIVAADSKSILQQTPVRLTATTKPCGVANAGTGGNACGLSFTLGALPVFGTGVWSLVSGPGNANFTPNAGSPAALVTVTLYGSYVLRWTETQGSCRSSADVTVVFYQRPVANAGAGGNECDLDFTLSAVAGSSEFPGKWIMSGGSGSAVFQPDASSPEVVATVSEYGTKVFTWIVTNGICYDSSEVAVNFYRQPHADAGKGGNNCGREYFLNAVPSIGTGTWTRVSGPGTATFSPDNHTPNAKVTVSTFGSYVFRWTEINGSCSSRASVTVGFFEQVSANAGNGGDECDKDFRLNAFPGTGSGSWSMISGPGNATFNPGPGQYNATVTVSQNGSYDFAWTEFNNSCSSTDIIRVIFHSPPSVNAGNDAAICMGNSLRLHANGSGIFLWSPANFLDNPASPDPLATPAMSTLFTVKLTDQWNCFSTDQVIVEVRERPVADAGVDQTLDFMFETELLASELNENETGEWNVISGGGKFSNKYSNSTVVSELSIGDNLFLWSVSNGVCPASSDTVLIKINELTIPTLITPNQDGRNDYFFVPGLESFGKTVLTVFNRWGTRLYRNEEYSNNWDGRDDNGDILPDDTYYYMLEPEKINAIKGYIVIKQ